MKNSFPFYIIIYTNIVVIKINNILLFIFLIYSIICLVLGDFMKENQAEIYNQLYMIGGNTEKCIDYSVIIESYFSYLSLFVSKVEGYDDFYKDKEFLIDVVNGFNYYQKILFEDSSVDDVSLSEYICLKYNNIAEESLINDTKFESEESDELIDDSIFKVSMVCQQMISEGKPNLLDSSIIRQLFSNSFNITTTLDKYNGKYKGM